jgi:hypothetical protein
MNEIGDTWRSAWHVQQKRLAGAIGVDALAQISDLAMACWISRARNYAATIRAAPTAEAGTVR